MKNSHYNSAKITGVMMGSLVYSHASETKVYFKGTLLCMRTSGTVDRIPVIVTDRVAAGLPDLDGKLIAITGQISTHNHYDGEKRHLLVEVFAYHIDVLEEGEHANDVSLCGVVCKPPVFRITPMGREICDVMIAVNRPGGRSSYIPCILWGKDARSAKELVPGMLISVHGRFQSRVYEKKHEFGTIETRMAYEISVSGATAEAE